MTTQTLLKHLKHLSVALGMLGFILLLGTAGSADLGEVDGKVLTGRLFATMATVLISFVITVYIEYLEFTKMSDAEYEERKKEQIMQIDYAKIFEEAEEVVIPEEESSLRSQ